MGYVWGLPAVGTGASNPLVLQNAADNDTLSLQDNGLFVFPTPLQVGANYSVSIQSQPVWANCSVSANATGTLPAFDITVQCNPEAWVSTLAIKGIDGIVVGIEFNLPAGVAVDSSGNVYLADQGNNCIRELTPNGGGTGTVVVGSVLGGECWIAGGGTSALSAPFNSPTGVAVDGSGNVYVADKGNSCIWEIAAGTATAVTLAGTCGTPGIFQAPSGVAVDVGGNVYVVDAGNSRIFKISPSGSVAVLAGSTGGYADGTGAAAQFLRPRGIAVDAVGNVYVADSGNNLIRRITPDGTVTTLAGTVAGGYADGPAASAGFNSPYGVAADGSGNVYVADSGNNVIRKIADGVVSTLAGNGVTGYADGSAVTAEFALPWGVAVDGSGNVYVGDSGNNRVRYVAIPPSP